MADIRPVTITLRDRQTTGGSIPGDAVFGEPFVNLYDGVLRFSGVTGGSYEPTTQTGVFEVGSTLYNQWISNRLNINGNFIISGNTGFVSTYGGTSGAGLVGKFLSGTSAGFVLGDISDIQGTTTRVQPGTNTTTGGTADNPTVNVVDSPSFNGLSVSGTGNFTGTLQSGGTDLYSIFLTSGELSGTSVSAGANITVQSNGNDYQVSTVDSPSFNGLSVSGTGNFTGTLQSGGTDLYSIFASAGSGVQSVNAGTNVTVGGTATNPIVNVVASPSFSNITFSGTATGGALSATSVSATTIFSAGTNLETVINNIVSASGPHTYVQPGSNTTTGGTATNPIVNVVDSPSFNSITYSGVSTGGSSIATNVSATTFYSGSTNLGLIINSAITAATSNLTSTRVQPGTNTTTGGTADNPTVNLVDSPSVNGLTVSGTGNFTGVLQSGGTNVGNLFVNDVTAGSNISIGGSANHPIIDVVSAPTFTGIVGATGYTDSSLTAGRVVYVGASGRLVDEAGFTYDANADTLNTKYITVGSPGQTGTTATIYGDVLIIGDAISGFTSELYIEDNNIFLNYNPTASTTSTSLGAGWSIQDGDGVAAGDVFFDIRGTATGAASRSFTTNLANIRVGETGTVSSPNGNFLLKETDILDGGSY